MLGHFAFIVTQLWIDSHKKQAYSVRRKCHINDLKDLAIGIDVYNLVWRYLNEHNVECETIEQLVAILV